MIVRSIIQVAYVSNIMIKIYQHLDNYPRLQWSLAITEKINENRP